MNTSLSSSERVSALLSFLNARSPQSFAAADIEALLREPQVADALERVSQLALGGNECVLGVDELDTDEADALAHEAELLREQIASMQQRLKILKTLGGDDSRTANKKVDQSTLRINDVHDQVYQETLALVQAIGTFRSSISPSPNVSWTFADVKHLNELYSADNSLLDTLDNVSKVTLAPNEDDVLSADVDLLSSQLADAQFRLFAAQVSQAYLNSLNQAPTPSRNRSGANTVTEIKTLQAELDGLVSHYEQATRLLARQRIVDRMSETLVRGRIERMEKELDAVQQVEDAMESMIGRMTLARDLTLFEMSKFDVLSQLASRSSRQIVEQSKNKMERAPAQSKNPEIETDMLTLQNLIGVRDSEDCRKLLEKATQLDQEVSEASLRAINNAAQETKDIITPLISALYEDSATKEIKFVNPAVLSQIRNLEKHIEDVKGGLNETGSGDGALRAQSQQFVKKWVRHG